MRKGGPAMRTQSTLALLAGLALALLASVGCSSSNTARAELKDASGRIVGEVTLVAASNLEGVEIALNVHDLPPGAHGVHIHDVGECDPPGFASSGGHFNPWGKQHGLENPDGSHAGDLPNLTVGSDGAGSLTTMNTLLQGLPGGENFFDGDGVALVIHSGPDDQMTDPSGDSGARIACGQISHD
jgi:superoxide dismutase, Cu-Zn family